MHNPAHGAQIKFGDLTQYLAWLKQYTFKIQELVPLPPNQIASVNSAWSIGHRGGFTGKHHFPLKSDTISTRLGVEGCGSETVYLNF
jgi:hypothetical protein